MKWMSIKGLSENDFRRLTVVKRNTFDKMLECLQESEKQRKFHGGRHKKISLEEMLLMTLEYLREYRTYFHIATSYDVSESYAYKIIRCVESTLIKEALLHLPGRKSLVQLLILPDFSNFAWTILLGTDQITIYFVTIA